jgi:hypothetical protein
MTLNFAACEKKMACAPFFPEHKTEKFQHFNHKVIKFCRLENENGLW